ncbi:hypothetical protein JIN84_17295 [Luteolibacter yonseiensis]|uniref:YknX-like C-terminal permuted SH3-like domain-containing protein n=1 Tax=Luteolibacter yonseiensis TaxID=1144680 RepID=A0A934R5L4_9BACT|nr:hypothetical protein [Luteolibacter yonseiensis]MBK1817379.1 hypothetical protein [Luteolibacter yonseiensis]
MKNYSLILTVAAIVSTAALNSSCQKSEAAATEKPVENGAQFKAGEGLSLTDQMQRSIGLKVEDVAEDKVDSSTSIKLTANSKNSASGWITPAQAAIAAEGMEIELNTSSGEIRKGKISRVQSMPLASLSDHEITISTESDLTTGEALGAQLHKIGESEVPVIPPSALLKTAEGTFVYTVNGKFFIRTPVKIGASNDRSIEIVDGLYAGDQVVTTPVKSLWMAELQVLRGGKACTCGH